MTVEEMKKKKTELGFSCEQISDRSGVPLGTVQKIFSGITKRPRYNTICQLEKAFPMEHIIFTEQLIEQQLKLLIVTQQLILTLLHCIKMFMLHQ